VAALEALGIEVYFVEDNPPGAVGDAGAAGQGAPTGIDGADGARHGRLSEADRARGAAAQRLERRGSIRILRPGRLLCGPRTCKFQDGADLLYRDGHHLNNHGALLVSPAFEPVMTQLTH
jgi:hypothetical protein